MKNFIITVLLMFACVTALNAQDMRNNSYFSLFSDQKAVKLGDAITIDVVESSQASNNAETNAGRASNIGFSGSGTFDGSALPSGDLGVTSNNDFRGSGGTKTSGMVRTKIAAIIDSVLDNGNLRIKGSRKIVINGEEQTVHISGFVRATDITADNTVKSFQISEAEIVFEGNGMIESSQKPGLLTKLFHWLF
ncbi:MAG: hypothetical protein SCALA702_27030 [Melioribacteraceae bacterium]|nr:MAG: hypothetical protein SCALA702_27030 [Melioribacteraceae bacterium]